MFLSFTAPGLAQELLWRPCTVDVQPWTTLLHAVTQLWHLSGLKGGFFVVAVYAVARRARGFLQGAGSDLLETYMCCCSIARARTLSLLNVLLKAYLPVSKAFQGAGEASSSISEPQAL